MKLYSEAFKATGRGGDITYVNFNHLGLYKKEYFDNKGDLIKNEYYTDYDEQNNIFSGLAIKEDRTYSRDAVTGLIIKRTTSIIWYGVSGNILEQRTGLEKVYTFQKGYDVNKRSRRNLLNKASIYFYSELLTNTGNDPIQADAHKNDFDEHTTDEQAKYIRSNTNPLVTKISESTDPLSPNYKSYITPVMAATMISILDINYDGQ